MARPGTFQPGNDPRRAHSGRKKDPIAARIRERLNDPADVDRFLDDWFGIAGTSKDEALRLRAKESLCDRGFGKPVQKSEIEGEVGVYGIRLVVGE
jgi:hypothetical protein